ncbi:hypothetical protein Clacol_002377 [Clathrus columnatus]|uniref:Sulfotransferase n=1 Tax=Clathrus columnatus TaxID=1419009 RepID=A0AAV5A5Z2_9AGAM|nr:hypothetical protein Clacol_002377 [Clathrus columnatus]
MSTPPHPNQPPIVFGTLSLCHALEKLGFGPCYHPLHVQKDKLKWVEWAKVLQGQTDPEFIYSILEGFGSALDTPVTFVADSIYKAYPNAKYILTIRDPDQWEVSVRKTFLNPFPELLPVFERAQRGTLTEEDHEFLDSRVPNKQGVWMLAARARHTLKPGGSLQGDIRDELLTHNAWIKELIPPENLLIFDVKEGWGPLVRFLEVESELEEPFPKVNESAAYKELAQF